MSNKIHRTHDPQTSKEAAKKIVTTGTRETHHKKIMVAIAILDGYIYPTGESIALSTGLDYHAVMRRMGELVALGKVKVTGTTKNSRGNSCSVYELVKVKK